MTSSVYLWRDLRFDLPQGFDDDSVLTFQMAGVVSLTVTRDALTGTVDAYAKAQEQAVAASKLKNYAATVKNEAGVVVVDRQFDDPSGGVVQRQAFKAVGKGAVVVVTGTTRAAHADKAKKAVVDVVQSLSVGAS